ncbi:hypothetical protein [Catenulispora rubra]|uniref:hypothetical protein n=1 Tax=Catenulispora rubra TaxID=280293 RepID=UPI001891F72C|nr:hypothetical protein [Catenulispora rubra]
MPNQASSTATAALAPALAPDLALDLAPDLIALFLGAIPHPDIVIPEPTVTVADLAAAARAEGVAAGRLRWDAAKQRFAS